VRNIVGAQLDSFRSLYGGRLKSFWKSVYVIGAQPIDGRSVRIMRQDRSSGQRALIASKLPGGLKGKIMAHYENKWNLEKALGGDKGVEEKSKEEDIEVLQLWERIVQDEEFGAIVDKSEFPSPSHPHSPLTSTSTSAGLAQIVGKPTFNQSLKGILSAGPLKSLRYVIPKLKKKWSSSPLPTPSSIPPPSDK
jgi:translocator assembly and maintenance protein 41